MKSSGMKIIEFLEIVQSCAQPGEVSQYGVHLAQQREQLQFERR